MGSIARDTSNVKVPAAWSAVAAYNALLAFCADIRARRTAHMRIAAAALMTRISFCMVTHHIRGARHNGRAHPCTPLREGLKYLHNGPGEGK